MTTRRTRFEGADPIFSVRDMAAAVRYYVDVLGFENATWADDTFTSVSRDRAGIYLCVGEYQGRPGARLRHAPRNYPWALEFHVEDLDGNVLRMGSEPITNRSYDEWMA